MICRCGVRYLTVWICMIKSIPIKKPPRLTIWLLGGLGNRLRTIDAAIAFCDKLGHQLEIIWPLTDEMAASYDDLFERVPDFKVVRKPIRAVILDKLIRSRLNRFIHVYKHVMPYHSVKFDEDIRDAESFEKLEEDLHRGSVFLRTCHPISGGKKNYTWLKSIAGVSQRVIHYNSVFSIENRIVGVHIRRTDHVWAIQQSPDELFIKYMRLELARAPHTKFFLFSDDEDTCERFAGYFGDSIMIRPKIFGRDSVEATQDALVDWLLLSKCEVILHSFWSSFSYTASMRFNRTLIEISTKNEPILITIYKNH